ncbi:hypothetical protein A9490_13660 [Bacillus thuringiensis]|uniref:AAA family ATPase n=1 Tax=Bacillus thuringiensis TaxID=1428 RepID=UPI0008FE396C|nr:AAA family ATPase [Bacillus thuringiensis]OJE17822.1 hypothetical protein A9490_13660 [Bacillus thuringiensis]
MKLECLRLENFRGFKDLTIDFSEKFTVLIGDNGTGKTAILDGISVALGAFLLGFEDVPSRHILPDEVRIRRELISKTMTIEPQYPVSISCIGRPSEDENMITWIRKLNSKKGRTTRNEATKIISYAKALRQDVRNGKEVILPAIAYYGTGRLWAQKRDKSLDPFATGSRTQGYTDCLDPYSNEKLFTKWLKKMKYVALEDGAEPGELISVKRAVETCLESLVKDNILNKKSKVSLDYSIKADEVQVTLPDGKVLPFRMLSDGYRNTIGIVADIAYRMSVLNPHLEKNASRLTPGIVLIDEIDLHLHPKWQRRIVDDLKRTFPNVQFIVTTHSPFIIQSLQEGELRILKHFDDVVKYGELSDDNTLVALGDYADKSIEDVTENVMGVELPQWSERKTKMYEAAEKYFKLLQEMESAPNNQLEKYKDILDELSKPYAENVAYYAFLNQKRLLIEEKKRGKQ